MMPKSHLYGDGGGGVGWAGISGGKTSVSRQTWIRVYTAECARRHLMVDLTAVVWTRSTSFTSLSLLHGKVGGTGSLTSSF